MTHTASARGDLLPFLRAWASDPWRVSAIAPSGKALAELITHEISRETGPILELGPGTGIFTRALLARGVAEEDITMVELGDDFARMLRERFPRATLLQVDAARLASAGLNRPFDAVISGLPLLSMPPWKVMAILRTATRLLRRDGAFYQFTYGVRCPVPRSILERLGLTATRTGSVLMNMPPAGVYRIAPKPGG